MCDVFFQKSPDNNESVANDGSLLGENQDDDVTPVARVSKAEKRRQKKVAAGKERDARIKEQESDNLLGPRHKEMVAIVERLRERDLAIHGIVADGNW